MLLKFIFNMLFFNFIFVYNYFNKFLLWSKSKDIIMFFEILIIKRCFINIFDGYVNNSYILVVYKKNFVF